MEQMILISNWLIYGGLFGTFFIKLTDEKERGKARKIAYFLLMCCTLFMSVSLFKVSFIYGYNIKSFNINIYETILNLLMLFLMWTKVKEDKFFNRKSK